VKLYQKLRRLDDHLICAYGWAARAIGLPVARRVSAALRLSVVRDMGYGIAPHAWRMLQRVDSEVSRFIATSSAAASRLMRQENVARDRIDIIPSGIDWQKVAERTPDTTVNAKHSFGFSVHQPVILMTAPFTPTSDYATFLRAAKHLVAHHSDARFVLSGQGDESSIAEVKRLADELRVTDNLVFVHDHTQQQHWMQAANVGAHASLLDSNSDTLLTYMAAGLPVVATKAGGAAEIINHGQTGYLVDPLDADALAMRIQILLIADRVAEEFVAAARNRIHTEFSVQREVQSYADYYHTLAYASSAHWLRASGSALA
jgi:glycosyltransferase involved in cell wall biosynthesis